MLALTATASKAVTKDICKVLRIPAEGVRVGSWDRPNLEVQVLRMVSDDGENRISLVFVIMCFCFTNVFSCFGSLMEKSRTTYVVDFNA